MKKGLIVIASVLTLGAFVLLYKYRKRLPGVRDAIIIGDSQAFLIAANTSSVDIDTDLAKVGWNTTQLLQALNPVDTNTHVTDLFICIGTNSGYSSNDPIEKLVDQLELKFPNAKLYVIIGSWGWGNIQSVSNAKVIDYYNRFADKGVYVLDSPIGFHTSHPTNNSINIKAVANEIDNLIV